MFLKIAGMFLQIRVPTFIMDFAVKHYGKD